MANAESLLKSAYWRMARFFDEKKRFCLRYAPKYLADRAAFKKAGGLITHTYPILTDFDQPAGLVHGHYFHQDLLVASFVHAAKPARHIDIGSRIDGFVAHVATFRTIEVLDIRPIGTIGHERIKFTQADLMQLDESLHESADSISCLHALEHFGLGRYGDPIDPAGHLKGFANIQKMLKLGGVLYISFPIGKNSVHFNAHRVFDPLEVLKWSEGVFDLIRFDYIDDAGILHCNYSLFESPPQLSYGCGIYTLKKRSSGSTLPCQLEN